MKTGQRIQSDIYWHGLTKGIEKWISTCRSYRKLKIQPDLAALVNIQPPEPLQLVCIDVLCFEYSKGGQENILVITGHFIQYTQAFPNIKLRKLFSNLPFTKQ
jgi:hypothetical protein